MAEENKKKKRWWRPKRWWIAAGAAAILVALVVIDLLAAFTLPKAQADLRGNILGLLTPLAALIVGAAALLNFQEARRQNVASLEVTRRGQVTDRFTKAIEQLGQSDDQKLDVRIGAIYALEQIAKDSEDLHWPAMQVLTAYLREHSAEAVNRLAVRRGILNSLEGNYYTPDAEGVDPEDADDLRKAIGSPARVDFLAIADVIRRRRSEWDSVRQIDDSERVWREPLNVEHCDLRQADLRGTQLERAYFMGAQLEGANFTGAHLEEAYFGEAQLKRAYFVGAQLEGADFLEAQLERANFQGAQLERASFWLAQLEETDFREAQLEGADFVGAQLEGADFVGARLGGANFREAQLEGADFSGVDLTQTEGLTQDQLDSVKCDDRTKPPLWLTISVPTVLDEEPPPEGSITDREEASGGPPAAQREQ